MLVTDPDTSLVNVVLTAPPAGIVAITPSDSSALAKSIRGFMVSGTGNVAVVMADGTSGTYPSCSAGAIYPGMITKINATGTTATGIVGFY